MGVLFGQLCDAMLAESGGFGVVEDELNVVADMMVACKGGFVGQIGQGFLDLS